MYLRSLPREKAVIIKFRQFGYSINHIAAALGRSTSYIHHVLKKAQEFGVVRAFSNRKMPDMLRKLHSRRRQFLAYYWMRKWEGFLLGAEEEPP